MPFLKYDGTPAALTPEPAMHLWGTDGADTQAGTTANEGLWGGGGDLLQGGAGDDSYFLKGPGDQAVELAGAGVDRIVAWHNVTLADLPHIENLSVSGDGLYAAGNALDNVLEGGAGSQQIYGGFGLDVLAGGAGADVFIVYKGEGSDVIQDFSAAEDRVRLKAGFSTFADVQARLVQMGADVKLDLGDGDGLIFRNLTVGQLTAANFQLQLSPASLGGQTFVDEFNALSLWDAQSAPTGVWRPDYGYQGSQGAGSYSLISNGELQIYTSPYFRDHAGDFAESPFSASAGVLTITARPSANPEIFGFGYTSGLITTRESFSQTYGYFEMRADVPSGAGAWPAFWLLPKDGSWPPELDVMEVLSKDPRATWTTQHSSASGSHVAKGMASYTPDSADGFHTYGLLWSPSDLVWYIDGVEVFRTPTPADLNKPMFMLANLALGGWGGPIGAGTLPAEFKIDYIKAWTLPAAGSNPPAPSPAPAPAPAPAAPAAGLHLIAQSGGAMLQGAAGSDTLMGSNLADTLRGGEGADLLHGADGFDDMHGNLGGDTLYGGGSGDWVVGGQGNDLLFGEIDGDVVLGNLGSDTLSGGAGDDVVRGGQGDDVLEGGDGSDYLAGDRGADTLSGGAGADLFHSFAGAGLDRILDFSASEGDRLQILTGATWSLAEVGADTVVTLSSGDTIVLVGVGLATLPAGWIFSA